MLTAAIFAGMRGIVDYTNYDDMRYAVGYIKALVLLI